jgi:cation diffusion facilitator family transporter
MSIDNTDDVMESNELGIRTLKITLIILLCTALLQLVVVLVSGSIALLADTIHNFVDASTSIPLWIAFALARRGASRQLTYGYGKIEDVAGVVIVLMILASAYLVAWQSIQKIINPVPMDNLILVTVAAIIGYIGNEWVAIYRIRVGKQIGSAAMIADGKHARADAFTSLAVLISVIGDVLGFPIVDSLVGIGITIAILFIVKDTAKSVWVRLIDGIEPDILAQIEHAPLHVDGVIKVEDIRARWVGHRVHTDITIYVDPNLSVLEADEISKKVERSLRDHVRLLSSVSVCAKPD